MKRQMLKACIGILMSLLLVACGPTPEPEPQMDEVTLQLQWTTQTQFAGYYVALSKGWYAEENIDLTIEPGGPDVLPVDRVTSGIAQFGTAVLPDLVDAIEDGDDLVSIAQIQQSSGLLLLAKKSSGISEPEDFVGKRVGVWLGGWETQFNALIAQEGIDPDSFELVPQGFSMAPFLEGNLDVASAMIYNEYLTVLESGISEDELNIIDYADYNLDFPGDLLFTSRDLLGNDPDLCVRMLRASLRGWEYAIKNPPETADIVIEYDQSGLLEYRHQLAMMKEVAKLVARSVRPIGYTERSDIVRVIATLSAYDVLQEDLQPEDVYDSAIWEQATAQE